jgi:hypothetical protein
LNKPGIAPQHIQGFGGFTMIKFTTAKTVGAMAAAALFAGLAVLFASVAPEARAETQLKGSFSKSDRLPVLEMGAACSSRGWPYYEQSCQFDLRKPAYEARTVRIIALR